MSATLEAPRARTSRQTRLRGLSRGPTMGKTVNKGKKMAAGLTTGAFALLMTLSGALYIVGARPVSDGLHALGYPLYFGPLLGVAKLLGVAGILLPGRPRLREWAYAGFV